MKSKKWTSSDIPDLTGKTIIVTGGNSGLGFVSARTFAEKGAQVIIACRSANRGDVTKKQIEKACPTANVHVMEIDLMDLESIKDFTTRFKQKHDKLDVLLNNAGIMTVPYGLTKDGFESQLGTNHLGHFALTGLLLDLLKNTPQSRVVNVSSMAHKQGVMDFDNLLFKNGIGYTPMKAYGRSKLANLLFTYELQEFFDSKNINCIAVAAHPGVSNTNLARHLEGKWLFEFLRPLLELIVQPATMGALPLIRASVDPLVKKGEYYGPSGFQEISGYPVVVESNKASHDKISAKKLWEISEKLTSVVFK